MKIKIIVYSYRIILLTKKGYVIVLYNKYVLLKGVYKMKVTCPKCDEEIIESDIEVKKAYCRSCMEWFVIKEDITVENVSKEEYAISGVFTWKESRYVSFSICLPKFLVILAIFFSTIYGLMVLFAIMVLIVNIIFNDRFSLYNYMYIFRPLGIAFPMVFPILTGTWGPIPKCILTKNSLKRFSENGKLFKEYEKSDIKKIIFKKGFIVIMVYPDFIHQFNIAAVERFFENKIEYNQFVGFINKNYKEKIEFK
jgi:hypothetical protein